MNKEFYYKRYIEYPKSLKLDSAALIALRDRNNGIVSSRYYRHPNFFNMLSDKTLTILSGFKIYEQTTEYTCGPCAALMVLAHYDNYQWQELQIAKIMDARPNVGTTTLHLQGFFKNIGWQVCSGITQGNLEDGATFGEYDSFRKWVIENLKNDVPIMVEWLDWLGHWTVIIGFDVVSDDCCDDVIIMADPYDTTDHYCDGYRIVSAERFFYMWCDAVLFPRRFSAQQWVIAKP
jgi:hypothetical protein